MIAIKQFKQLKVDSKEIQIIKICCPQVKASANQSKQKQIMSNHFCSAKQTADLLACVECGNNQICCKQCFAAKHRDEKGIVHKSCKLVESDVYKNFLRVAQVEWLVGQKVMKSLGEFQLGNDEAKQYLTNTAFYGSSFFKELFTDQLSSQQYLILKCYYGNTPQGFQTLSSLQKVLNSASSLETISKYISKLTQPTEQEKVMNSHIDFYTGADIYYLAEFFSGELQIFYKYVQQLSLKNEEDFSVYKYIEWRQKSQLPRNATYYSNEFTAFVIQYYRKDLVEWAYFTLNEYILNYWQFFHTAVQVNPTLKQFIDSEVDFYNQYENLMQENGLNITYLGFKVWKLSNGVSKQLPYLKNHYFLFAFVEGYLKMKIQRTYAFTTQEEKDAHGKQSWQDFVKYIKDYSLLLQNKNKTLKEEEKKEFDFGTYTIYHAYRKRMEPFHDKIKNSKENIYDRQVAVKFLNEHFPPAKNVQLKPKLYKQFFQKCEQEKRKEQQKLVKLTQSLKAELEEQEKQAFYEFIYLNFINFCKQSDLRITKERYYDFKNQSMQTMDEEYIKLTEEKFKRGDFNVQASEETGQQVEEKQEEPKVMIGETGAKITVGMDKYEEEILEDNLQEGEDSDNEQECGCCGGNMYNCKNVECQMMGYCTTCTEDY